MRVARARQRDLLLGLGRGEEAVFAESPPGELAGGRLIEHARKLAAYAGVVIGTKEYFQYRCRLQPAGKRTQLIIRRNRGRR